MATTRMGSKGQVVLPKDVRARLRLRAGARLGVKVRGRTIVLEPQNGVTEALAGLGREIWKDVDLDKYLDEERASWER